MTWTSSAATVVVAFAACGPADVSGGGDDAEATSVTSSSVGGPGGSCECKCDPEEVSCPEGQVVDDKTCECTCSNDLGPCPGDAPRDPETCACSCPSCPEGTQLLDEASCECGCPLPYGLAPELVCAGYGANHVYDPVKCGCRPCEAGSVLDDDLGVCTPCGKGEVPHPNSAEVARCVPEVCALPADAGPCDGFVPRWRYDSETGTCTRFAYGGCGGNANNFTTLEECLGAGCVSPCELPAEEGLCSASFLRWRYDSDAGTCTRFVYGGCGGNANNFTTLAACLGACGD